MKVSVVDLSENQKKVQVEIPTQKVRKELDKRYRDLARHVRVKGFRPGKVPRRILESYYGKSVQSEVSQQFIKETFPDAIRESELKPLAEAEIDDIQFGDDGGFAYSAVVDVCPPFEAQGYRELEIERPAIEVSEEQVDDELDRLREQHAEVQTVDEPRETRAGDVLIIDFIPSLHGEVYEKGRNTDLMVELGKGSIHPELDQHLTGKLAGDTFTIELNYPEDTAAHELAGQTVQVELKVKELKEKTVPELDDELARAIGEYDTLESLRRDLRDRLHRNAEQQAVSAVREQIREQLLEKNPLQLSDKVVEQEVDYLLGQFQHQFEAQGLRVDPARFQTPEIRTEYREHAEKSLCWRLVLGQIAEQEGIELSDEDMDHIYADLASMVRADVEDVKQDESKQFLVDQMKTNRIQEKTLEFLEQQGRAAEPSEDSATPDEE